MSGVDLKLVNRRRLGLFLGLVAIRDTLLADLGPVLSRLILAAPDRGEDYLGPGHLVLAEEAEAQGRYAAAAGHYRHAVRHLLRRQTPQFIERAFLGEADAAVRYHPQADLAARPHLCDARVLLAQRKLDAARAALAKAKDLALGDKVAMAEVKELEQALSKEDPKEKPR